MHSPARTFLFLLSVWSWISVAPVESAVIHVTPGGDDGQSGAEWNVAKKTVAGGLITASQGDEIWVAAGTYYEHVRLKNGVALYGGFAGREHTREERDWMLQRSVLDGGTNGVPVTIERCGPETVLDGFTIQNGLGHGIYCLQTAGTIRQNLIRSNVGSERELYGGGVLVSGASPDGVVVIESNRILDNATFDGGGIACIDASPRILRNRILWNLAYQNGGGISCWRHSSPFIAHNVISANTASWVLDMPVPIGGGGIFTTAGDLDGRPHPTAVSAPLILNNVITANGGWRGGGLAAVDSNGGVPLVVNNTVVANNGSGIFWGSSSLPLVATKPIIQNNIVAYNPWGLEMAPGTPENPNIEFNCVSGNQVQGTTRNYHGLADLTGTKGNVSVDPGLAAYQFGQTHLVPESKCIDAGIVTDLLARTDIDDQARVLGSGVDIGADEFDGTNWSSERRVVHVDPQGDDQAAGISWATAKRTIQGAIDAVKLAGGDVWVAAGTYREHINLPAFVYVYGGFAGTELDARERRVADQPTIIDGEGVIKVVLSGNGGYLVSRLDGFTVRNGGNYTGGAGLSQYGVGGLGGGIYLGVSSPIIANNLITRNSLAHDNRPTVPQPSSYGAGIYAELSYAVITGNTFRENEILNTFDGSGAGLYCTWSMPTIERNVFRQNHARYGSAIHCSYTSPVIRNNLVQSNAMYNTYPLPLYLGSPSGAITLEPGDHLLLEGNTLEGNVGATGAGLNVSGFTSGRIQNNLFLFNRAEEPMGSGGLGGGLYCLVMTNAVKTVAIVNNTFVGNHASTPFGEQGGAMAISLLPSADKLVIANNLMVSNSSGIFQTPTTPLSHPTLLHNSLFNVRSNYINLPPGETDLSLQPAFRDPVAGDYHLLPDSPGIDAGSTPFAPVEDLDSYPRPLDGDGNGLAAPDLGAFEHLLASADSDTDGMPDGWEWDNGLQAAVEDRAMDRDADGLDNFAEYVAGTAPNDSSSVLRLTISMMAPDGSFTLSWCSVIGRVYTLEAQELAKSAGYWAPVGDPQPGTGDVLQLRLSSTEGPGRFYRVLVSKEAAAN